MVWGFCISNSYDLASMARVSSITTGAKEPAKEPAPGRFLPLLRSPRMMRAFALLVLAAAVAMVYAPAATAPFLFDDFDSVIFNPSITRLWPLWGTSAEPGPLNPPAQIPTSGRPLVNLTLAVNASLGGGTLGYHLFNMLLHLANAWLVWAIVARTLKQERFGGRFSEAANALALLAALVWAVHPLQTEAVEYITQRTELMVALCYLSTLYASIRWFAAAPSGPRGAWLALATVACAAGMACKEVMVTAPLVVLLYQWTFIGGSARAMARSSWPLYAGLACGWLVLLALNYNSPRANSAGTGVGLPLATWWLTQCQVLCMYLRLVVWPWPLSIHYEMPYLDTIGAAWPWLLATGVLIVATVYLLARRSPLGFAGAFVLGVLSPTSLTPIITEVAAERRMYLPLAALAAILVMAGFFAARALVRRLVGARVDEVVSRLALIVSVIGFVLFANVLAMVSSRRLALFESPRAMWEDVLRHQPENACAHANLGIELYNAGRSEASLEHFEAAMRIEPKRVKKTGTDLGNALVVLGRADEAIGQFETVLSKWPDYAPAHAGLGSALLTAGRAQDAIAPLKRAIELQPRSVEAQMNLAIALSNVGKTSEAVAGLEAGLKLQPNSAELHRCLGVILANSGQTAGAIEHLRDCVRLAPNSVDGRLMLGVVLLSAQQPAEAVAQFEAALRIDPNHAEARNQLKLAIEARDQR